MLKLTAPVLRNAATSRARLQTGRFCALSPPENNALAQPPRSSKAGFWRFPPVQRTDVEGQQRVGMTSSARRRGMAAILRNPAAGRRKSGCPTELVAGRAQGRESRFLACSDAFDRELASPKATNHGGAQRHFSLVEGLPWAHPQSREGCHLANVSLGHCAPRRALRAMHRRVIGARQ